MSRSDTLSLKKLRYISNSSASNIYERQCQDSHNSFSKSIATLTQFHFTREAGTVFESNNILGSHAHLRGFEIWR